MFSANSSRATPRDGVALPIALAAIVVVGALVAGVFFASTQEYRVGRNTLAAQQALHGAEVGLSSVVSSWTPARTTNTKIGSTQKLADTVIGDALVQRQFTKVSPTVFWVTSTAAAGSASLQARALKRLNTIIRVQTPDFRIMGAITSRGATSVSGSTIVSGTDTVPAGWDCPPGEAGGAGVVVANQTDVSTGGVNYQLTGDPAVKDSATLVSDTMSFTRFGGFSYDSLALLADKVRTGGGTIGIGIGPKLNADNTCNTPHADNWGDTSHVDSAVGCDSYYPIVHLQGATSNYTLNSTGGGQGILLVDGNLALQGSFKWTGIVLVRGTLSISGTAGGVKLIGAVAAMNRAGGTNTFSGNSSTTFSRCAINQVTARHATASPLKYRPWADMSF